MNNETCSVNLIKFGDDMSKYKFDISKLEMWNQYYQFNDPFEFLTYDLDNYIREHPNDICDYINIGLSSIMVFSLLATVGKSLFSSSCVNNEENDVEDLTEIEVEVEDGDGDTEVEVMIGVEREDSHEKPKKIRNKKNRKRYNSSIYTRESKLRKCHHSRVNDKISTKTSSVELLPTKITPVKVSKNEIEEIANTEEGLSPIEFTLLGNLNPNIDTGLKFSVDESHTEDFDGFLETCVSKKHDLVKFYNANKSKISPQIQSLLCDILVSFDEVIKSVIDDEKSNLIDLHDKQHTSLANEIYKCLDSLSKSKKD